MYVTKATVISIVFNLYATAVAAWYFGDNDMRRGNIIDNTSGTSHSFINVSYVQSLQSLLVHSLFRAIHRTTHHSYKHIFYLSCSLAVSSRAICVTSS